MNGRTARMWWVACLLPAIVLLAALVGCDGVARQAHVARHACIAGALPDTASSMMRWIEAPPSIDPQTAMPDLCAVARDARDIADPLYSIEWTAAAREPRCSSPKPTG